MILAFIILVFLVLVFAVKAMERGDGREVPSGATEIVRLAIAMANSDGFVAPSESAVIVSWAQKHSASASNPAVEKIRMNLALKEAVLDVNAGRLKIHNSLIELNKIGVKTILMEAVELCSEVLAADGLAHAEELRLFNHVVSTLNVGEKEARACLAQHISAGVINPDKNSLKKYHMLGISVEMSQKEIKTILIKEFRKWSGRSSHSNVKIREEAADMLMLIGSARAELLK
ncbi:MAG: hypothetical protein H8E25_08540 [Planctomycetes bacterium]|nr:hypothetical protein [Planctomycetota bacterium]